MLPQRLDITLAFKALSLSAELTSTEKQVAAAIIDSFNYRTQQCDPSFDRIAHLVGRSRRTIIRAVQRLETARLLMKVRHGGHFHRNRYQPNWARFRQLEASWKARKATRHWGSDVAPLCVSGSGHIAGDRLGTQTIPINQSTETSASAPAKFDAQQTNGPNASSTSKGYPVPHGSQPARLGGGFTGAGITASANVARLSAERRWNSALLKMLAGRPELYAQAVEAIDSELQQRATEIEMDRKGTGLAHVIEELTNRGLKL